MHKDMYVMYEISGVVLRIFFLKIDLQLKFYCSPFVEFCIHLLLYEVNKFDVYHQWQESIQVLKEYVFCFKGFMSSLY